MKKVSVLKVIFWNFLLTTILLLGGGLLVSCDSILDGNEFKEKLEKDIAYANAKECTLAVKSDSQYGSFLSDGEKICKLLLIHGEKIRKFLFSHIRMVPGTAIR